MNRLLPTLLFFLVAGGAVASEEPDSEDRAFWSDTRGIIFPLEDLTGELDIARLGQLHERYEEGMKHLEEGRWAEAAEALEEVAAELPVADVLTHAAIAHFQLEQYARAQQLLELVLNAIPDDIRGNNLLGLVLSARGYPEDAQKYLENCRALAEASDNRAFVAYAMLNLAQVELELGHPEEATRLSEEALAIGKDRRSGNVTAAAQNNLGNVALYQGDYKTAEKLYRKSLQVERRGKGNDDKAAVLNNLAQVLAARGQVDKAHELLLRSLDETQERKHRTQEGSVLVALAGLEHQLGNPTVAEEHLATALAIFKDLDLARGILEVRLQQARIARAELRTGEALEFVELARIASRDVSLPQSAAELDLLDCELLLDHADAVAARKAAESAAAWYEQAGQPVAGASATLCWAESSAALGANDEARGGFERALAALDGHGDAARVADAQQRYGLFLVRQGEVDAGRAYLEQLVAWLRSEGRDRELAISLNVIGYALSEAERPEEALACFEEAEGVATTLGDEQVAKMVQGNRVNTLVVLDRYDEALQAAGPDPTPELLERLAMARAQHSFRQGLTAMDEERWDDAATVMERVLEEAPEGNQSLTIPAHTNLRMIDHHLGLLCLETGDLECAASRLSAALEHVAYEEDPGTEARLLKDMAVVRTELVDQDRALGCLDQALPAAVAAGDLDLQRSIHFQIGLVTMESDDERSRAALAEALRLAPDARDELAAASEYNLGIVLYRLEELADSRKALESSRAIYASLGMTAQVSQIDAYLEEFPE